jgi:hypothetical protein
MAAGCQGLFDLKHKGSSPLAPAHMTPDCCVFDIYIVNVPLGDPKANEEIWSEIDEQAIDPGLRQRLAGNGFRVGLVGTQMPASLSQLMELNEKQAPTSDESVEKITESVGQSRVSWRHIQIRPGQPFFVNASEIYEHLPVMLWNPTGQIDGESYDQAQGVLSVAAYPQPDGQVRLEVTPELQHGIMRQNYLLDPNGGVGQMDWSRRKRIFNELAVNSTLAPGSMLLLCSLPNRPGSLGDNFFTNKESKPMQKILILRLSLTQHDGLFDVHEPLQMPEK